MSHLQFRTEYDDRLVSAFSAYGDRRFVVSSAAGQPAALNEDETAKIHAAMSEWLTARRTARKEAGRAADRALPRRPLGSKAVVTGDTGDWSHGIAAGTVVEIVGDDVDVDGSYDVESDDHGVYVAARDLADVPAPEANGKLVFVGESGSSAWISAAGGRVQHREIGGAWPYQHGFWEVSGFDPADFHPAPEPAPTFAVGDKVRIISSPAPEYHGRVGVLGSPAYAFRVNFEDGDWYPVHEDEIEKVEEEPAPAPTYSFAKGDRVRILTRESRVGTPIPADAVGEVFDNYTDRPGDGAVGVRIEGLPRPGSFRSINARDLEKIPAPATPEPRKLQVGDRVVRVSDRHTHHGITFTGECSKGSVGTITRPAYGAGQIVKWDSGSDSAIDDDNLVAFVPLTRENAVTGACVVTTDKHDSVPAGEIGEVLATSLYFPSAPHAHAHVNFDNEARRPTLGIVL